MSEAKEVCRAFRNLGQCRFGDQCPREHSNGNPVPRPARYPSAPCPRIDTCTRGPYCPFYHSEEDKQRVVPDVCRNYRRGNCQLGDKCTAEHIAVQPEEKRPLDCPRWVRDGDCKQVADNFCVYIHDPSKQGKGFAAGEEPKPRARQSRGRGGRSRRGGAGKAEGGDAAPAAAAQGGDRPARRPRKAAGGDANGQGSAAPADTASGDAPARRRRRGGRGGAKGGEGGASAASAASAAPADADGGEGRKRTRRNRRPRDDTCFAFRDGTCTKGSDCAFRHGTDDNRELPERPRRKVEQICYKFKNGEECPYGDKCRYLHDKDAPDPTVNA